jgi:hypothetical protein
VFRKDLLDKLQQIFRMKKGVTLDASSDQFEQDTMFVEIFSANSKVQGTNEICCVDGCLIVFSQDNKMPFGFIAKRIAKADKALTAPFMFTKVDEDIAESPARMQNIHERRTNFRFLYSAQYDPSQGNLTSLELELDDE